MRMMEGGWKGYEQYAMSLIVSVYWADAIPWILLIYCPTDAGYEFDTPNEVLGEQKLGTVYGAACMLLWEGLLG